MEKIMAGQIWKLNTDGGYRELLEIFSKPPVCYTWEVTAVDRHPPLPQSCLSLPDAAAFMKGVPYRSWHAIIPDDEANPGLANPRFGGSPWKRP